ncbi:hypothetical protein [Gymnodinialimonas hymeniacidonis]|uniref:hypothetical protein n=1 Tax=Gymnodinialimonas hymeniacidonis TaxID=3126508 RepID=UPI0034C654C5
MRAAFALALAGATSLLAVLLAHEILTFGAPGHGLINADRSICPDIACPTTGMIVVAHIAKAIGAAFLFGIIGAVWISGRTRIAVATVAFSLQYLWSLVGMASGYRIHFGTTWAWWEPFTELLWHPALTLALMVAGLALLFALDRLLNRLAHEPPTAL